MQHSLTTFLDRKKRSDAKPAVSVATNQRPASRLVQALQSQLVRAEHSRPERASGRQQQGQQHPSPILAAVALVSKKEAGLSTAEGSSQADKPHLASKLPDRLQQVQARCGNAPAAERPLTACSGPPPEPWPPEPWPSNATQAKPLPAAGNQLRPCPVCGQLCPVDSFEAHLQRELAMLDDSDNGSEVPAAGCSPLQPGPTHARASDAEVAQASPLQPSICQREGGACVAEAELQQRHKHQHVRQHFFSGHSACVGGLQRPQQQPQQQRLWHQIQHEQQQQHGQEAARTEACHTTRHLPGRAPLPKRQRVLVLGGQPQATASTDAEALQQRQQQRVQQRRRELAQLTVYNHYADGKGFWEGEDIGIDGCESAGLAWEGMGTTSHV